jgi:hypothetical protein
MTSTPNATHTYAGRVVRRSRVLLSFRKHAAGKIYASAVAETPPVISSVTPKSHVTRDTSGVCVYQLCGAARRMDGRVLSMDEKRMTVVKKTWRCMLKAS